MRFVQTPQAKLSPSLLTLDQAPLDSRAHRPPCAASESIQRILGAASARIVWFFHVTGKK